MSGGENHQLKVNKGPAAVASVFKAISLFFGLSILTGDISWTMIAPALVLSFVFFHMRLAFQRQGRISRRERRASNTSQVSRFTEALTETFDPDLLFFGLDDAEFLVSNCASTRSLPVPRSVVSAPVSPLPNSTSVRSLPGVRLPIQQSSRSLASLEKSNPSMCLPAFKGGSTMLGGSAAQAIPGMALVKVMLGGGSGWGAWSAMALQGSGQAVRAVSGEAAVAFQEYTGIAVRLNFPVIRSITRFMIEALPRVESFIPAFSLGKLLYELAKVLAGSYAPWSLMAIVPFSFCLYAAPRYLYDNFDRPQMSFRLWGLSLEQQGQLWRGESVDLPMDPNKKGDGYHLLDRIEYKLVGWTAAILRHRRVHHGLAGMAYAARFGSFGFNLIRERALWQVIIVSLLSTSAGGYIGYNTFNSKFRSPDPNDPLNYLDPRKWCEAMLCCMGKPVDLPAVYVTNPLPSRNGGDEQLGGGEDADAEEKAPAGSVPPHRLSARPPMELAPPPMAPTPPSDTTMPWRITMRTRFQAAGPRLVRREDSTGELPGPVL